MMVQEGNDIFHINEEAGPGIPVEAYLTRFFKYTPSKKHVFISSLIYLDRVASVCGTIVNSTNVHRLYLICNLMAAKLVEETTKNFPVNNKLFATVGGVSLSEINDLEMDFLADIDFRAHISLEEFRAYAGVVEERLVGMKRVWVEGVGEGTASSTYHVYKQFIEGIQAMERALQQQRPTLTHSLSQ